MERQTEKQIYPGWAGHPDGFLQVKTELWIVGVVGGAGAEEEHNMQKKGDVSCLASEFIYAILVFR